MEVNTRSSYKEYKNTTPDHVDIKLYLIIFQAFVKFMMNKLFDGVDITLPSKLGVLGIRGRKQKPRINDEGEVRGMAPDWGATKKLWNDNEEAREKKEIVYCFNEHSNGYRYNIVWFRKNCIFINKHLYALRMSRENKRRLSALITNSEREYLTS